MFNVASENRRSPNPPRAEAIATHYNRRIMTVKDLRELLDPKDDNMEVVLRVGGELKEIARVYTTLEPDTAEDIVAIEAEG